MSISNILRRFGAELEENRKLAARPQLSARDAGYPEAVRQRRIQETAQRIERLEADRQAAIERYDAEILAEREALRALEEAGQDRLGPQPEPPDEPDDGGGVRIDPDIDDRFRPVDPGRVRPFRNG